MDGPGGGAGHFTLFIIAILWTVVGTASNSTDSGQTFVSWRVLELVPCTVECGGGIQKVRVTCVEDLLQPDRGRPSARIVSDSLCPEPAPPSTRSCNNHPCPGRWVKGDWSACSTSCGPGNQTREVKCMNTLWIVPFEESPMQCGGSKPATRRKCHLVECPFTVEEPHSIVEENYTLIQLYRTKKLKVNVGGEVNLLPGQTVVVKCPVKHYAKKLVYWTKGYKLVSLLGRVKSDEDSLLIRKFDPATDAGVYSCIAGDQTAAITVNTIEKDDPLRKTYKKWIRKSKRRHQNHPSGSENNGRSRNDVLTSSSNTDPENLGQQRDQSPNVTQSLTYFSGSWSACSASCGSQGHRKRKVSCSYVAKKYVKIVPDAECSRMGLVKPESTEVCRPQQACAVWRPGPWTKCYPSCGQVGRKVRYLTCVWEDTGKPAFAGCDIKKKPVTRKPCKPHSCPLACVDNSKFCNLASRLKMCRFAPFRQDCCRSCHDALNEAS